MANEIFRTNRFAIAIVSAESFLDDDPGFKKPYTVQTYIIRLNHVALAVWQAATATDDREDDETWVAWHPDEDRQTYRASVDKRMADFKEQIAAALQITGTSTGSFSVVRVLSEIFAVVYIPADADRPQGRQHLETQE